MAKLKYDRPINISMRQYQTVTIPKDEVWKVSTDTEGSSAPTKLFGGGRASAAAIQVFLDPMEYPKFPASPSSTSTSSVVEGVTLYG